MRGGGGGGGGGSEGLLLTLLFEFSLREIEICGRKSRFSQLVLFKIVAFKL